MLVQARHNAFNNHNKPSRNRRRHQFSSSPQLHSVLQILAILHVSSCNNNNSSSSSPQLHSVLQILAILHVSSYNNNNSRPVHLQTVHNFFYFVLIQKPELNNMLEIDESSLLGMSFNCR
jgi:hypothetical protein